MKQKTIMILVGIAAALQTVSVLFAVLMTVFQSTVKQIYNCDESVCNIKSVPTGAFAELLLTLFGGGEESGLMAGLLGKRKEDFSRSKTAPQGPPNFRWMSRCSFSLVLPFLTTI